MYIKVKHKTDFKPKNKNYWLDIKVIKIINQFKVGNNDLILVIIFKNSYWWLNWRLKIWGKTFLPIIVV